MSMKTYYDLKDMLCEELDEITRKGELTAGSLDTVDKLTHSIKSLETIIAMNGGSETRSRAIYGGGSDGYMTNRADRSNARRGRGGRYSRADARAEMIDDLRDMMQDAPDDHTRQRFQHFISELENA
jgi:hypothetical protein